MITYSELLQTILVVVAIFGAVLNVIKLYYGYKEEVTACPAKQRLLV